MPDYPSKRLFIALPLDEVAIADLRDAMSGVGIEGLRLTRPENLHVTLKFLGDVDDPLIADLIVALKDVAAGHRPFDLAMTGVTYLPDARRARVLAAAMDRPAAALTLFEQVEQAAYELGFPREGRPYRPHITVGRFRRPPRSVPPPDSFRLAPTTVPVTRLVLVHSTLGAEAPVYTELADFPLG